VHDLLPLLTLCSARVMDIMPWGDDPAFNSGMKNTELVECGLWIGLSVYNLTVCVTMAQ